MKICGKCKIEKDEIEFYKDITRKDGLCSRCKKCEKEKNKNNKEKIKEYQKEYYENNKEKKKESHKNYHKNNAKKIREKNKNYHQNNADKINERKKEYYLNNKEKIRENQKEYQKLDKYKEYQKEYFQENKEKIREKKNEYNKARLKTDPCFKLSRTLRTRLNMAIRNDAKKGSAVRDLGVSVEELKKYLEYQFQPGMSWENYGREWEIDHIIAFKDIDILDEGQLKLVLSYTNLRPCWKWANLARRYYNDNEIDFSSPVPKYFELNCEKKILI